MSPGAPQPPQEGEPLESLESINRFGDPRRYHGHQRYLLKEPASSAIRQGSSEKIHTRYVPDDLEDLEKIMASIYYVNLSVLICADCWAIELFPIMPIHRLNEDPTRRGILADLTCDSDGKIDRFIDLRDVKSVLELHPFKPGEPYYRDVSQWSLPGDYGQSAQSVR